MLLVGQGLQLNVSGAATAHLAITALIAHGPALVIATWLLVSVIEVRLVLLHWRWLLDANDLHHLNALTVDQANRISRATLSISLLENAAHGSTLRVSYRTQVHGHFLNVLSEVDSQP